MTYACTVEIKSLILFTTADNSLTTSSFLNRTILNPNADNAFSRQKSKDE
jgi:hypothetical protein